MPVLVHELIAIELWREKVYPHLVTLNFAEKSTVTPYITVGIPSARADPIGLPRGDIGEPIGSGDVQ